jgi:molecular chaperone GrpE
MIPKEPEEKKNNKSQPPEELPEETPGAEQEASEDRKKADEYLANWQRAQADFINYKRRAEQERLEFNSFANAGFARAILPILDDLERAIDAIPEDFAKHDWVEGVKLVERKFKTSLEGQGVKPILSLGMQFDPNLHEAIRQDKGQEGMVIAEYQKGYMLNGKLLRPARVVVGNGEEEIKAEEKKEEE